MIFPKVFFVVVGAMIAAVTFRMAGTVFQMHLGLPYHLIWISFGQVVGVYYQQLFRSLQGYQFM
ncbi:MAG: hypothetical protein L0H55_14595 [Candidatus Nitrosocosmicus sp.]|nr:hypothetical protein [Candidatus Nitrosocosmicus sp.]